MHQYAIEVDHHGQTIRGMSYVPEGRGRFATMLLMHGFTGQRIESGFLFVRLARALAERGVAAVTFDFLNSGESDGSFEQMLVTQELADAMRMTRWLAGQPFADRSRLGLLGFSLGGLLAGCVVGRTEVYKALVLLAPTTEKNLSRHAQREASCELAPDAPAAPDEAPRSVQLGPHCLHPRFFDDLLTLDSVGDCIKHPRPTLLIQGTADTAVPPEVSHQFTDAMRRAAVPVDTHPIAGADHGFNHPQWRAELIEKVVTWTAAKLGASQP